jgi:hypothetical protein
MIPTQFPPYFEQNTYPYAYNMNFYSAYAPLINP